MAVHLGFDMGIRNLAYCLMRHDLSGAWTILAWDNVDLLEGGASAQTAKSCHGCGAKTAKWCDATYKWCEKCATRTKVKKSATATPTMSPLPCAVGVKGLRPLAVAAGVSGAKKLGKDALLEWATGVYLMPWKPVKTMSTGLDVILTALDTWLTSVLPTFSAATLIRLENQPAMTAPTMKSVQMILFTLLYHRLRKEYGWTGRIEFVHAGVKSRSAVTTDLSGAALESGAAYRARKKDATEEVLKYLPSGDWRTFFEGRSKKSDLADAFLMALRC